MAGNILDDPARLKTEREAADREYNDALTRLDRAIQQLPANFPHPPPGPDEHQVTPLNALWRLDAPRPTGLKGRLAAVIRRAVAPLFEQQQAFNSALVDHINRNIAAARESQAAAASTLTVLRDTIVDLVRFQSMLVSYAQQITPYVDTRDRDVAGLLRSLSSAINAVADEMMKRTDALIARETKSGNDLAAIGPQLDAIRTRLDELAGIVRVAGRST